MAVLMGRLARSTDGWPAEDLHEAALVVAQGGRPTVTDFEVGRYPSRLLSLSVSQMKSIKVILKW